MLLIVEREIAEQMDKLVQERLAECLKTHIPQATSNRGSPNRSLTSMHMETEDQNKSRLTELKQNDRLKAEAADKEKKEKEKVEVERKAKVTDEIHKLGKAARLEKEQKGERLRKEAEALELQGLKEEEE